MIHSWIDGGNLYLHLDIVGKTKVRYERSVILTRIIHGIIAVQRDKFSNQSEMQSGCATPPGGNWCLEQFSLMYRGTSAGVFSSMFQEAHVLVAQKS
jgi:hypothetical protein